MKHYRRQSDVPTQMSVSSAWIEALRSLDRVAAELESKWGVGRLPTLVNPELAAKFGTAADQLNEAIEGTDETRIIQKCSNMRRGWLALDAEAMKAGHKPNDAGAVWMMEIEGQAYAVVRSTRDVTAIAAKFPDHVAISAEELLRIMRVADSKRTIHEIKDLFPGATVETVKKTKSGKAKADWKQGDSLPDDWS